VRSPGVRMRDCENRKKPFFQLLQCLTWGTREIYEKTPGVRMAYCESREKPFLQFLQCPTLAPQRFLDGERTP
jgi:hypothetical protein